MDLVEGLRLVASQGAPAQALRAGELLEALSHDDPAASAPARALLEAFLHDPDLWR